MLYLFGGSMGADADRREYRRVHNEFNVRIARQVGDRQFRDMIIDMAIAVNISAGGLLVAVKESLDLDEKVRVTFLKPNTFEFFEGMAQVMRCEKRHDGAYLIGLQFIELSVAEKKRLNYYITLLPE